MSTSTSTVIPTPVARWGKALVVHLVSVVVSLAFWMAVVSLLVTGIGASIVWVGLPIIAAAIFAAHGYARLKKRLAAWQGDGRWTDLPPMPRDRGWLAWLGAQARTAERWHELAYALVGSLLDWLLAFVAIGAAFFGAGEIAAPFSLEATGILESFATTGAHPTLIGVGDFAIGVVSLGLFVVLVWAASWAQIGLTKAFLTPSRKATAERLRRVERARRAGEQAEAASLARLERDLHDGPQQNLLRTGLDLADIERRLDAGDVAGAKALLADVRTRNETTLADIRALSRGYAPPVLAEHGLGDAIAALVAACSIPATATVDLGDTRPSPAIERAVYYGVCEALANAARHSGAGKVSVTLRRTEDALTAEIVDDGRGGAVPVAGHGLAGLSDRMAAVGGTVDVESAPGHGTAVRVTVPAGLG
jgi:signal transduction histidine kinase